MGKGGEHAGSAGCVRGSERDLLRFIRKGCVAPMGKARGATSPGQGAAGSEGSGTPSPGHLWGGAPRSPPGANLPAHLSQKSRRFGWEASLP